MEKEGFGERRRYIRFDMETKINFQVKEGPQKQTPSDTVSAITKNFSVEGVCFVSDRKLEPGTILKLEVFLPSQPEPLNLEGQVVWFYPSQKEGDKEMFDVGVKLFTIKRGDESKFLRYAFDKMMERLSKYLHL